jgi:hypothetical protein
MQKIKSHFFQKRTKTNKRFDVESVGFQEGFVQVLKKGVRRDYREGAIQPELDCRV